VAFAQGISTWVERPLPDFVWKNPLVDLLEIFFSPMAFAFISVATAIYEKPLHQYLNAAFDRRPIGNPLAEKARRRLPQRAVHDDGARSEHVGPGGAFMGLALWQAGAGAIPVRRAVFNSLSIG